MEGITTLLTRWVIRWKQVPSMSGITSVNLEEWIDKAGLSERLNSAVRDACDTLDDLLLADQDDLEIVSVSLQP